MAFRSYRDGSNTNWGTDVDGPLSIEQINCGSQMRLADAMERQAKALERIANVLECRNASGMAKAIIRMDARLAKRTPLKGGRKQ